MGGLEAAHGSLPRRGRGRRARRFNNRGAMDYTNTERNPIFSRGTHEPQRVYCSGYRVDRVDREDQEAGPSRATQSSLIKVSISHSCLKE